MRAVVPYSRRAIVGVLAAVCALGLPAVITVIESPPKQGYDDFSAYYFASACVARHVCPYQGLDSEQQAALWTEVCERYPEFNPEHLPPMQYFYPPHLSIAMVPLTWCDPVLAKYLWTWVSFGLLIAAVAILARIWPVDAWLTGLLLLAALLNSDAVKAELFKGQADILTFALTCGALLAYVRRKPGLSSALLAAAVAIKVTPLVILAYPILRREWRYVGFFCLWSGVLAAAAVAAVGVGTCMAFFTNALPAISLENMHSGNQTFFYLFHHLFGALQSHWPSLPEWPGPLLTWVCRLALLGAYALAILRSRGRAAGSAGEQTIVAAQAWGAGALVGLVCGTSAWLFVYFAAVLPFFALLLDRWVVRQRYWMAVAVAAFFFTQYQPAPAWGRLGGLLPYLCLVGALALTLMLLMRLCGGASSASGEPPGPVAAEATP
jgi:hypothetical protein